MKKRHLLLLAGCMMFMLTSCSGEKGDVSLNRLVFDRGHGSMWGNQFYIEVTETEIVYAAYFPEGASEQTTCQNIPITEETWASIVSAVDTLKPELVKDTPTLWEKLAGSRKQDGGEYRKLTLSWQTSSNTEDVLYKWPASSAATQLETLLQSLLENAESTENL